MLLIRTLPLLAACAASVVLGAAAAEAVVSQKDKEFSEQSVTIRAGENVRFSNEDAVVHNLTVREPGGANRQGISQRPGESTSISFPAAGAYSVYCLIHPKMRMSVKAQ